MPARYRAAEGIWLKPDDHAAPKRLEPGETFIYSGHPPIPAIPLDAAPTSNLAERRRLIENFIRENPITEGAGA